MWENKEIIYPKSKIQEIDKTKYWFPMDLTVAQFSLMIRKRVEIAKEGAFFLLVGGKHSITGDTLISEIYERYKDEDGFLYIAYASELIGVFNVLMFFFYVLYN